MCVACFRCYVLCTNYEVVVRLSEVCLQRSFGPDEYGRVWQCSFLVVMVVHVVKNLGVDERA